jgi:ribokinase
MKALVIGGATIDVITSINTQDIEKITMHNATNSFLLMEQGKKIEALRIDSQIGGGATNAAVAMARMGVAVHSVLKIGQDADGDQVIAKLKGENINTDNILRDDFEPTGKSIIISSHERNSGIFVNRGANSMLKDEDITPKMFEGMDLVYVSTLSAGSAEVFPKIVRLAKEAGALVACNPGIRQLRRRCAQVIKACQWIDIFALNADEARVFAEGLPTIEETDDYIHQNQAIPKLLETGLGDSGYPVSLHGFVKTLHHLGPKYIIITDGAEGAYLGLNDTVLYRPTVPCTVESTIGAGDAFNATFVAAIASKQSGLTALNMAAVNAASVASHLDTQSGLMTLSDLQKRLLSMDSSRVLSFALKET